MKFIVFIFAFLTLIQYVLSFCIDNRLETSSSIDIQHNRNDRLLGQSFSTRINQNDKRCCDFSKKECSSNGKDDETAYFTFTFTKDSMDTDKKYNVECTTGGDLTLYNQGDDFRALCKHASGNLFIVPITTA